MKAALRTSPTNPTGDNVVLRPCAGVLKGSHATTSSDPNPPRHARFEWELTWVLISILLLLYLVTSYFFWAKTGSGWPIGR